MNLFKDTDLLMDKIAQVGHNCLKHQASILRQHLDDIHKAKESSGPILALANAPFYPESEYVTRQTKIVQKLKQKLLSTQEKEEKAKA